MCTFLIDIYWKLNYRDSIEETTLLRYKTTLNWGTGWNLFSVKDGSPVAAPEIVSTTKNKQKNKSKDVCRFIPVGMCIFFYAYLTDHVRAMDMFSKY